jgi:hypothetical protein
MFNVRHAALLSFIVAAVATRILPHPPNFTALGAMGLFAGVYVNRRWAAFVVPLVVMLISDAILSLMWFGELRANQDWFSYFLFAAIVLMGMSIRERASAARVTGASIGAAAFFFIFSNLQVWIADGGKTYPFTTAGLAQCYIAAIPFGLNMLLGNLVYGGLMFGAWRLLQSYLSPAPISLAKSEAA